MSLTVRSLSLTFAGMTKPALDGVSLSLPAGGYLAVLGENGSGKSTLARAIAGLAAPDSGSISIDCGDGIPAALVFQVPSDQLVAETVELDVAFGPENVGLPRAEARRRVWAALDSCSITGLAACDPQRLSTGRKQLVALAGALALEPAVLILDEPTSMLSPRARSDLLDEVDALHRSGGTIVHITHDLDEAMRAERILVLNDGRVAFDGATGAFRSLDPALLVEWGILADVSAEPPPRAGVKFTVGVGTTPADTAILTATGIELGPLRGLDLGLSSGTVTAVTGESGSGKSLLLETLVGLTVPAAGTVNLKPGITVSLAVQESEASLFEEFVADDVAFAPRNAGLAGKALVERVTRAMDLAGLPFIEFAERRTFTLSGGERRKAALAGVLAMDADVLLLDEPSSALDARSRARFLDLVVTLARGGKAVAFTTNREEECAVADRVVRLPEPPDGGETPAVGTVPPVGSATSAGGESAVAGTGGRAKGLTRDQATVRRLRDGARGSFRRLDTPIHRLPPACKYLLLAAQSAAVFLASGIGALCALVAVSLIVSFVARVGLRRLVTGALRILPWLVLFGAVQYAFDPGNVRGFLFIARFFALYVPLVCFTHSTSHTEIMHGMEDLLRPLTFFGFPARDASLVVGIVFRFVSILYAEAERITVARIIRSSGAGRPPSPMARLRALASLFVPLVLRTLSRADRLAEAIVARKYGACAHTRYLSADARAVDLAIAFLFAALSVAVALASRRL